MSDFTNSWQIFRVTVHRDGADDADGPDGPVVEVTPGLSTPPEAFLPDGREARGRESEQDRDQR
jgi:hypothetical protein